MFAISSFSDIAVSVLLVQLRVFVQNTASLPPFRVRAYHFSVSSLKIMQSYMRKELLRMQFSMSRRRLKQGFFKVHFCHFCKSHILLHQIFSILK